jgi:DNA methylase
MGACRCGFPRPSLRTSVWDYASVNSLRGSRREDLALHPTVKPTGLVADAISDVTRRGDLVLDLFLGSGTTLMAAERTGRRFRGLDIDPAYVDVDALERAARPDDAAGAQHLNVGTRQGRAIKFAFRFWIRTRRRLPSQSRLRNGLGQKRTCRA